MNNLFESLVSLEERLHRAGRSCAVIGGVAAGVWGEPRVTRDEDVKVLLGSNHASRLLEILAADYIPLQSDPLQALAPTGIQIIDKLISTRTRDREDAASVVCRQENTLDDEYVLQWLRKYEQALDNSTLVTDYQTLENASLE